MSNAAEFRQNPDYSQVPVDLAYVSVGDVRAAYDQGLSAGEQRVASRIDELETQVIHLQRKLNASETDRSELRFKNRQLAEQLRQPIGQAAISEVMHG